MATTTKQMTKAQLRAFLEGYLQAWNAHDIDKILASLTPDVVWATPVLPEPLHGTEAVRKDLEEMFAAFQDLHLPVEDSEVFLAEDPSRAVTTWTFVATMTGPIQGMEATGRPVRFSGTCLYRMRDGLISEHRFIYDSLDMLAQLGYLPRQDSLAFKAVMGAESVIVKARKRLPL